VWRRAVVARVAATGRAASVLAAAAVSTPDGRCTHPLCRMSARRGDALCDVDIGQVASSRLVDGPGLAGGGPGDPVTHWSLCLSCGRGPPRTAGPWPVPVRCGAPPG
jgi:hypothetical protein